MRDHRAAGQERRQRLEHVGAAVEAADAVRPEHLVPREHGEVDAERRQVERQMRRGLAGVEHGQRADAVRQRDEFGDRVHDSEHVGDVREGDDAGAFADDGCRGIQIQLTVLVHGDVPQDRPGAGGELLPGHEVGVVLDLGHDDLVTRGEREPRALGAPRPSVALPIAYATRFRPAVAPLVHTSCSGAAPTKPATVARASSNSSVASAASVCAPRCTAAFSFVRNATSASITARGFWLVAAESRYTSG